MLALLMGNFRRIACSIGYAQSQRNPGSCLRLQHRDGVERHLVLDSCQLLPSFIRIPIVEMDEREIKVGGEFEKL